MGPDVQRIRELNDALRTNLQGGRILLTQGVQALGATTVAVALSRLRTFSEFTPDNDPHGEHDFGSYEVEGSQLFFKIDYYDASMEGGSEDPSNPVLTTRVLTLMLASEY